jgi:hypothetical protein
MSSLQAGKLTSTVNLPGVICQQANSSSMSISVISHMFETILISFLSSNPFQTVWSDDIKLLDDLAPLAGSQFDQNIAVSLRHYFLEEIFSFFTSSYCLKLNAVSKSICRLRQQQICKLLPHLHFHS